MAINGAKADQYDFNSADVISQKLSSCWKPSKRDVDDAINEKDVSEARILDLARNNGYIRGAASVDRDTVVGSKFLLQLTPSKDVLGAEYCDWTRQVEDRFHEWADDPQCWVDARRSATFVELLRLASTQLQQHGEYFFTREFRRAERQVAAPLTRTCFFAVDPCRVYKDHFASDKNIVGGVEVDRLGAPVAYHFTRSIDDKRSGVNFSPQVIKRVPKFNRFGWQQVYHGYEHDRAEQTRGFSRLMSIVMGVKNIDMYESRALAQADNAARFGMYVKSDYGPEIFRAFGDERGSEAIKGMLGAVKAWAEKTEILDDGIRIPKLAPNDTLGTITGNHPNQSYEGFVKALLKKVAAGTGISYEQLARDYENTSYSSARASLIEAWRAVSSKRDGPISRLATMMFRAWMDEQVALDRIQIPSGIQYFDARNRAALTRCRWIGSPKGEVDPLKAARANQINRSEGFTTLSDIAAERGQRWDDLISQGAIERVKHIEALEMAAGVKFTDEQRKAMLAGADLIAPQQVEVVDGDD